MSNSVRAELVDGPAHQTALADALYQGRAVQQMRTSYATAVFVQKPRELRTVERNLLEEARLAGEDFYYGWAAGGERIEGPSVGLAEAAARCWGNCAIETLPVQEMSDAWVFSAAFVDLETGFTITRQFRQSKRWTVHGKLDAERKDDVRFQIGQSKATRNIIINALPRWLIDKAMSEAKAGVKRKIEEYVKGHGIAAAVDLVFGALAKVGVKEAAVLDRFGVASKAAIDVDRLVILRGDLSAIETGQARPNELFPPETKPAPKTEGSKAEQLAEKLTTPKPAETAGFDDPPKASEPTREPGEDDPQPGTDDEDLRRDDLCKQIEEGIRDSASQTDLSKDPGRLMNDNREFIGEERYGRLLEKYQARWNALTPPKKSRVF